MKTTILSFLFVVLGTTIFAQKEAPKMETVIIQTTAECDECKERIESKLNYTKGIKFAELEVDSKKLTVKFKPAQISLEEIKKIIVALGYDADEMKADPKAYEELPACCKVGGM